MSDCFPFLPDCLPCKEQKKKDPCVVCEDDKSFSIVLGDVKTYTVPATEHELKVIRGTSTYDANGEEIGVQISIDSLNNVTISGNISLLDSTLTIF
jgi:hypothetical protein